MPAGFTVERGELDRLVAAGTIACYQLTPQSTMVYLRELKPGERLELGYRLRAENQHACPADAMHKHGPASLRDSPALSCPEK